MGFFFSFPYFNYFLSSYQLFRNGSNAWPGHVRRSAAGALKELKVSTPEVISLLLGVLQDENNTVRINAISFLKRIEKDLPNDVVKGLFEALRYFMVVKDENIRNKNKDVKVSVKKLWDQVSSNWQGITSNKLGSLVGILGGSQEHVNVLKKLGSYYDERLEYEKAAMQYIGFLELGSLPEDPAKQAALLTRTVKACVKANKLGLLNKAEDYFATARLLFDELEEKGQLGQGLLKEYVELLINTGLFYLKTSNYDNTVEKYFNLALQKTKANQGELKVEHLEALNYRALLALKEGNYDKAVVRFKKAKAYYNKLKKKDSTDKTADTYISMCKGMASSYIALNKLEEACLLCEKSFDMVQLLNKNSFASFDRAIETVIDIMNLQISCTKAIQKREKIGIVLKNLERMPEDLKEVQNEHLQEAGNRLEQFRPKVLEALVYCYGDTNVKEAEKWIKKN
jgi:tetratricopeptide (TPR) repeat protein